GYGVVGTWHNKKLIVVKLLIRYRDEGLMPAAVVPVQHPMRQTLGQAEVENAFRVSGMERELIVLVDVFFVAGQLREEAVGRQLPLVADHDHLTASRDGTKRVDRLDLRGLVYDEEVERDRSRLEELSHRERAHEKDRLDPLNDR